MTENALDWAGQAFRVGSPPRAAAMAGRSGSGARGAPMEKPRPLSLLKVTPTRVMEQPEREGDVLAGLGATPSASAGLAGWVSASSPDGVKKVEGGWLVRGAKQICGDGRTNGPARPCAARTHLFCICANGGRSAPPSERGTEGLRWDGCSNGETEATFLTEHASN